MKKRADRVIITGIYILIYIAALAFMRNNYHVTRSIALIYTMSIFGILALCLLYMVIGRGGAIILDSYTAWTVLFLLFELGISYIRGFFVMPGIILDVLPWPLIVLVFYTYFQDHDAPELFSIITYVGTLLIFLFAVPNIRSHVTGVSSVGIFSVYFVFSFIPMVFFTCSQLTSISFCAIASILLLMSRKRAGFLIILIGVLGYYFVRNIVLDETDAKWSRLLVYSILGALLISLLFLTATVIDIPMLSRLKSIGEDGGSGRIEIWEDVIAHFNASTLQEKLLGHGFHTVYYTVKPLGYPRYAHNSYIEWLYDYGIVGLGLLLLFVIRLFWLTGRLIKTKAENAPIMVYTLVSLLMLSLVSYFFDESAIIIPFCAIWGACLGIDRRRFARPAEMSQYRYIRDLGPVAYVPSAQSEEKRCIYLKR